MSNARSERVVFVSVVGKRGFVSAVRDVDCTLSTVRRVITRLNERLSACLISRNTRHLVLTEAGAAYHTWCQYILRAIGRGCTRSGPRGAGRRAASARPGTFGRKYMGILLLGLMVHSMEMQVERVLTGVQSDPNQNDSNLDFRIEVMVNSNSSRVACT